MRKHTSLSLVFALALIAVLMAAPSFAAGTWTGWITDSHCGAKGANAKHTKACAEKCAHEKDGKVVFYNNADQKIYDIDKTDLALEHVGHEVTVTGTLTGTSIKVDSIAPTATK
ncbi:MAG TPA: hypothetical protein VGS22_18720 [Thermoanaerobaculia bacterium]|jgi:hypothetical protein|nr:hypothetical protein [Thermoanaerobaculia bacterium]